MRGDYRETLSDLHLEYVRRWTTWAHAHGSLTRNQAHGAPGNLVDLYAAADIPETEVFGTRDEAQLPLLKLASSAAHVSGRPLASAEAFTWLGEHFQATLAQARAAADWLFLAGVNQLVFHGVPYSPPGSPWPGWQFYASVNFGPQGGLWRDLPELTAYLARCQSILQSGEPDEDVLLYYPVHDAWRAAGELVLPNPTTPSFQATALALSRRGYAWDAVSDRLLAGASVVDGRVRLGSGRYGAIVVPTAASLPPETARRLAALAREGALVLDAGEAGARRAPAAHGHLRRPRADGGRRSRLRPAPARPGTALLRGEPRRGRGRSLDRARHAGARRRAPRPAVRCRRRHPAAAGASGRPPGGVARAAARRVGRAADVRGRAFAGTAVAGAGAGRGRHSRSTVPGTSPSSTAARSCRRRSRRTRSRPGHARGDDARRFAGTARYATTFERPGTKAADWQLDLGRVAETARVRLNGRDLGLLWNPPFRVKVGPALRAGTNTLELDVTNLAANRVRDLDVRGERWKYFHDANVVGRDYKPLDASRWPLRDSGLLGPVTLAAPAVCVQTPLN